MGEPGAFRSEFRRPFTRHKGPMAAGTLLGAVATVATVGLMALSGWFLSAAAMAGLVPETAHLFNFFIPSIGLRIFAVLRTLARYGERVMTHEATFRILETLRVWFYNRVEPLAPAGLWRWKRGDLLNRVVTDIDALDQVYLRILSPGIVAVAVAALTAGLIARFHGQTALHTLVFMAVAGVGGGFSMALMGGTLGKKAALSSAALRSRLIEGIEGLADLTLLGALDAHREQEKAAQHQLIACERRLHHMRSAVTALVQILAGCAVAGVVLGMGASVVQGRMSGPLLAASAFAVMAAFEALTPLPAAFLLWGRTREAARRIREITDTRPAVTFVSETTESPAHFGVAFDKVTFRYRPGQPPALEEVTLTVPHGRRLAVVGESGAGKSTLCHLLVRFFDPEAGRITLGERNIRHFSEVDLRRHVVVLSQEAHIFAGTIRENLLLAMPNATDAELWAALSRARLAALVKNLPKGLDAFVGESGRRLSTGEARRLALSRAVLKDAPVWVLDEPTEGLDRRTEREVTEALLEVTRDRTVLWITHRMTALERMDGVAVMEGGRIWDTGTHAALLSRNARYRTAFARLA